jgi:hypothetical protein
VPDNSARKKRIRAIAQHAGVPYTAAMRLLDNHVSRLDPVLEPGAAAAMFHRPVGILARPELAGPVFIGSTGVGENLDELRLRYGPAKLPQAFVVTNVPLPGEQPASGVLVTVLHNFLARHREAGLPRTERVVISRETLAQAEQASREPAEVWLGETRTPGVRVRVDEFEAVEIPHLEGRIVYCGLVEHSAELRLDLDRS